MPSPNYNFEVAKKQKEKWKRMEKEVKALKNAGDIGYYREKEIPLPQIVNASDAVRRIRFSSPDEVNDPEIWRKILTNVNEWKKYVIYLIDVTPDEGDEEKKKYLLVYGQKRLYAAMKLGLEKVAARVYTQVTVKSLDPNIYSRMYREDYASLSPYEKGALIKELLESQKMTFEEFASKTGLQYATLRALQNAYRVANTASPFLKKAYEENKVGHFLVNRLKSYYRLGSDEYQKKLTDFLVEYGEIGWKYVERQAEKNTDAVVMREKILRAMDAYAKKTDLPTTAARRRDEKIRRFKEINDLLELSVARRQELAELFDNIELPKGRLRTLYFLAADGIVDDKECNSHFYDGIDLKNLVSFDYIYGCLKKARESYDNLENLLIKKGNEEGGMYWSLYTDRYQKGFLESIEFPKGSVNYKYKMPDKYSGYKEYFAARDGWYVKRFIDYLFFCTPNASGMSNEYIFNLYKDEMVRGYFNDFCSSVMQYRFRKKSIRKCLAKRRKKEGRTPL